EAFFDNGVLHAIREWLEPSVDGSLPPLLVQSAMLDVLEQLSLTKEMIRDSRIGRIVNFLSSTEKTTPEIQKRCKNLVAQWSKGLYGTHPPASRVEIEHRARGPGALPKARAYVAPAEQAVQNEFEENVYLGAIRPTIEPRLYKFAPKSEVSGDFAKRKAGGGGGGGEKDTLRKIHAITQNKAGGNKVHIGGIGDRAIK
ncbi:Transcription factor iws1, partial [Gonapodya sp. JEL0774]